ncbi:hypothetical protein SEPCBS57363_000840 [Sporothrix epigloea]|uniref:Heterokaryon incompatibility domain-containing protein n=1 Tax=Sporothrix epigloea TaxID=1892477 RepID=A0ABP0D6Y0_9PEZI
MRPDSIHDDCILRGFQPAKITIRVASTGNMRLIDAKTLELAEYYPPKIPKYAILSHTWGPSEVTFQDFQSKSRKSGAVFGKITGMARLARKLNHRFIWVDTCCIDKTNNSELSEAINSMYQWYRDAAVCVAYLDDVQRDAPNRTMFRSRWFTRGWTLQELVAPRHLYFYDSAWVCRGSKTAFYEEILQRTNIPHLVLAGLAKPTKYSLARRMSWAAGRETKRVEDIAYCLLGILDVNMPLLYGEGRRSFRRLQEEIIKRQCDMTIFAWRPPKSLVPEIQVTDTTSGSGENPSKSSATLTPVSSKHNSVFQPSSPGDTCGRASPVLPGAVPEAATSLAKKKQLQSTDPSFSITGDLSRSASISKLSKVKDTLSSLGSAKLSATSPTYSKRERISCCLLAPSPDHFAEFGSLHPLVDVAEGFTVNNRGILMAGSVYLLLVHKPSSSDKSKGANSYLLLLGKQKEIYVGVYLSKVGPNLFQRDWDMGIAKFEQEDVMMMNAVLVQDWYILIDPAEASVTEMFRQHSIHMLSHGYDNKYLQLQEFTPSYLWDVQDRLFLRPKLFGWTRYGMVLAVKCAAVLRNVNIEISNDPYAIPASKRLSFVMLCQYQYHQVEPKFILFAEKKYQRETEMIMVRRAPNNSLLWADLNLACPHLAQLPDYVMLDVGEKNSLTGKWHSCWYRISTVVKKEKVCFEYDEPELYNICFDIKYMGDYDPAKDTSSTETDAKAATTADSQN